MSMRIGVICEGSHDFNVLKNFIDIIVREAGETVDAIECLQPLVSATFQETGGGWTQVKSWCERQGGKWYRSFLDKPLFATSKNFDILIIHLDGDVVSHCSTPPINDATIDDTTVERSIELLKTAIMQHWLQPEHEHFEKIVTCLPVRHLEAWLSVVVGPQVASHEGIDMKDLFRSGPAAQLTGDNWREKYIDAARIAAPRHREIEVCCTSYRLFRTELTAAAQAA